MVYALKPQVRFPAVGFIGLRAESRRARIETAQGQPKAARSRLKRSTMLTRHGERCPVCPDLGHRPDDILNLGQRPQEDRMMQHDRLPARSVGLRQRLHTTEP